MIILFSTRTGCWSCEAGRSSKRLFYCVSRCVTICDLFLCKLSVCYLALILSSPHPSPAVLTDLAAARFRSPWRPWRTHRWRRPARCSVHREDRHLRKHRGEGPADQEGCHATRVRAWRLEDHQSAVRGEILIFSPVHLFFTRWSN